jgi:4-hydroxybenzoate polyprenyltransferase
MRAAWQAFRLIHPFPTVMVVATSLLLVLVAHGGNPGLLFLVRAGATVALSQVAVGALNEIVDLERDRVAQPEKPLPSGLVSKHVALCMVFLPLVAIIPLAGSFGVTSLILVGAGTAGGLAYDLWLKPTPISILGYLIGFLCLLTWIWHIAGGFSPAFLLVYPVGTLALLAAHLGQSYPDIEGDRSLGQRGLAAVLGPERTLRALLLSYWTVTFIAGVLVVATQAVLPALFVGVAVILGGAMALTGSISLRSRRVRTLLFYLLAPGLVVLAIACFIAISRLH